MKLRKVREMAVKSFLFGTICMTLYIVTAPLNIPTLLGLGEIRVVLIGVLSRIFEEVLYEAVKGIMLAEEILERKVKA